MESMLYGNGFVVGRLWREWKLVMYIFDEFDWFISEVIKFMKKNVFEIFLRCEFRFGNGVNELG